MEEKEVIELDYMNIPQAAKIARALSSELRLQILQIIESKPMNISEVADKMNIPISSTAAHIRVLEDAGLVVTTNQPGRRGSQKVCGLKVGRIEYTLLQKKFSKTQNFIMEEMPVGNYFDCHIVAPCGIVSEKGFLSSEDSICGFYSAQKYTAQLVWLSRGYLEYRFSNYQIRRIQHIDSVEFSFEICSEAPAYNNNWKSDITIWINGIDIGTLRCNGDYGGRKGKLNPDWWSMDLTQFGELRTLSITHEGCYIDRTKISDENIDSLKMLFGDFISFRIGLKEDSKYVGGLNLFGEKFGDYPQNIVMKTYF